MDRVIETSEYGLCIYSMDILQNFIKREKIKTKKLLAFFQKDKKKYLQLQKEGIWIPLAPIDAVEYCIKIKNYGEEFDDEWEKKFEYEGFYLVHRPFNKYHIKQMQIKSLQYHPFCISSGKQLVPC